MCFLIQENSKPSNIVAARDAEIRVSSDEREKAIVGLTHFLRDSCKTLQDASKYITMWIDFFKEMHEHTERAMKVIVEKH